MRLLVLGGTAFVGRAIVTQALAEGHEVTLFSRGRTGTDLFPVVSRRIGDREIGDYAALTEGSWDAAVDVSATSRGTYVRPATCCTTRSVATCSSRPGRCMTGCAPPTR